MFLLRVGFALCVTTPGLADVFHVDNDALPGGAGTTWSTAFRHLQDALQAANDCPGAHEIRIAQGTYLPDRSTATPNGTGDRNATYVPGPLVSLRGGFAGLAGASLPDDWDPTEYETVLSGDLLGNDVPDGGRDVLDDNAYHVLSILTPGATPVISGVTISGGSSTEFPYFEGGGALIQGADPVFINCTFVENYAWVGGGLHCMNGAPTIESCNFNRNWAQDNGGGAYISNDSLALIANSHFVENFAGVYGSGLYNQTSDSIVLDCQFIDNMVIGPLARGGGMYNRTCQPYVEGCLFRGNFAEDDGAGLYNIASDTITVNCTFVENTAFSGAGVISVQSLAPVFANCLIVDNIATESEGGGGGALNDSSNTSYVNCTLANNHATGQSAQGGGMLSFGASDVYVDNSVFWSNSDDVADMSGSQTTLWHCDIESGWAGAGGNNLSVSPGFVGEAHGEFEQPNPGPMAYALADDSPLIDCGRNAAVPDRITIDLSGNPRFVDLPLIADCVPPLSDCGLAPIVDIGAFEAQLPYPNLDDDGVVGAADLAVLLGFWGVCEPAPANCPHDLNGDGVVNAADLAILLGSWG